MAFCLGYQKSRTTRKELNTYLIFPRCNQQQLVGLEGTQNPYFKTRVESFADYKIPCFVKAATIVTKFVTTLLRGKAVQTLIKTRPALHFPKSIPWQTPGIRKHSLLLYLIFPIPFFIFSQICFKMPYPIYYVLTVKLTGPASFLLSCSSCGHLYQKLQIISYLEN